MRLIHAALAIILVLCLAGVSGAAVTGKGGKKGKHLVHGRVVSVQMDANNKGSGTITVLVHHHKKGEKGGTAEAPVEKTFKVSAGTKFTILSGKKGAVQQQAADASALQKGDHVLISGGTNATDVKIIRRGKGKKAA
jgi:hypothetical protein